MNCSKCGAPLNPGTRFCNRCGAPVDPNAQPSPYATAPSSNPLKNSGVASLLSNPGQILSYANLAAAALLVLNLILLLVGKLKVVVSFWGETETEKVSLFKALDEFDGTFWIVLAIIFSVLAIIVQALSIMKILPKNLAKLPVVQILSQLYLVVLMIAVKAKFKSELGGFDEMVKIKSGFALGLMTFLAVVLILCFVVIAVLSMQEEKKNVASGASAPMRF